jgi:hypothetical protein
MEKFYFLPEESSSVPENWNSDVFFLSILHHNSKISVRISEHVTAGQFLVSVLPTPTSTAKKHDIVANGCPKSSRLSVLAVVRVLRLQTVCPSEISVNCYQITWHRVLEEEGL